MEGIKYIAVCKVEGKINKENTRRKEKWKQEKKTPKSVLCNMWLQYIKDMLGYLKLEKYLGEREGLYYYSLTKTFKQGRKLCPWMTAWHFDFLFILRAHANKTNCHLVLYNSILPANGKC